MDTYMAEVLEATQRARSDLARFAGELRRRQALQTAESSASPDSTRAAQVAHDAYEAYRDSLQEVFAARAELRRIARRVQWARYEEMALMAERDQSWNPLSEAVVMMRLQPLYEELESAFDALMDAELGVLLSLSEIAEYA